MGLNFLWRLHDVFQPGRKSLRMSKLAFQPGLKLRFGFLRFLSDFSARLHGLKIIAPVYQTGLGFRPQLSLSTLNRKFDFKRI